MKFSIQDLGFTKGEARILLLAITVLTAGFCFKYYDKIFTGSAPEDFDFTRSDREFSLLSSSKQNENTSTDEINAEITVNINTASLDELTLLDGIGPSLASAIISYRSEHGTFARPEDLLKISGIGKKKFEKIKNNIKVK
jgi:comEA protein